jgi:hypothetical protein
MWRESGWLILYNKVLFIYSFLWPPKNIKVVHLSFICNDFPFGSKRAFILQDIHPINMQCWTLAIGEMHRHSGWASIGCHSISALAVSGLLATVDAAHQQGSHGLDSQVYNAGGSVFIAWGRAPNSPLKPILHAHLQRANQGGNGLAMGSKGQSIWTDTLCSTFLLCYLLRLVLVHLTTWNLFLIKLIPFPIHWLFSLPMVLVTLGRLMLSLHYWCYYIEELLKS